MQFPHFYTEGCNFIRHYSSASLNVRFGALVQGLALLSAWGYTLFRTPHPNAMALMLISLFGLLFTTLLFFMHRGYLRAADEYTAIVIEIEKSDSNTVLGPVRGYEEKRREIYRSLFVRYVTIHATFSLIGAAFCICLIYSIYLVFSGKCV